MRTGLVLSYMLGLYVISFSISMSLLYWGKDAEFLFFLLIGFQILHVFFPDISVHCALIKCAYI
jgi:hypothetical protein